MNRSVYEYYYYVEFNVSMCKISHDNERSTTLSRIDKKKLSIEKQRGDTASAA